MNCPKILAVDDDPSITDCIKAGLELEGWEVFTANNGEDAINMESKQKPDLIVLDLMMPNPDMT